MSALVQANHLSYYYGNHCAVDNVSFSLNKGEILGFLGVNGAGKTTTLKMLSGHLIPRSGSVFINGVNLLKQAKSAKHFLGYLADTPPLYPELTVYEYLSFCAKLHYIPRQHRSNALKTVMQRCHLEKVAQRLIKNLSKGFQQRVGIAQAIIHQPKVILLDEPTIGLDPVQIREIRQLINELAENHAVILSTHILSEIQETCSNVQIIHQGRLILSDSISHLQQRLTKRLIIETQKPIDKQAIQTLKNITLIETLSTHRLKIHYQQDNPATEIAKIVHHKNWGLIELSPETPNLETLFIELTTKP